MQASVPRSFRSRVELKSRFGDIVERVNFFETRLDRGLLLCHYLWISKEKKKPNKSSFSLRVKHVEKTCSFSYFHTVSGRVARLYMSEVPLFPSHTRTSAQSPPLMGLNFSFNAAPKKKTIQECIAHTTTTENRRRPAQLPSLKPPSQHCCVIVNLNLLKLKLLPLPLWR